MPPADSALDMGIRAFLESLRRFNRLPPTKRSFAIEAALTLLLAWLLVRLVPARYWLRFLDTAAGPADDGTGGRGVSGRPDAVRENARPMPREAPRRETSGPHVPRQVGRLMGKVVRHLPIRVRCLPQAMAAQWMLRRRGVRGKLMFGVRRGEAAKRPLEFHAWLTVDGECVVGGGGVESFAAFPPFTAGKGVQ